jgi:hypothetical protein
MTTLQGRTLNPLTYGQVKANKEAVDQLTATGLDLDARIESAIAFLKVVDPDIDCEAATPIEIMMAATAAWRATFYHQEEAVPASELKGE